MCIFVLVSLVHVKFQKLCSGDQGYYLIFFLFFQIYLLLSMSAFALVDVLISL